MTAKRLLGFTAFLALASLTAGCGGGAGFGSSGVASSREVLPFTSSGQLAALTGVRVNEETPFTSAAISTRREGADMGTGTITFHGGNGADGGDVEKFWEAAAEVHIRAGENSAGNIFRTNSDRYDENHIIDRRITVGDDGRMVRHHDTGVYSSSLAARIFVPADGSNLHVGGFSSASDIHGENGGLFGIFGERTTRAERRQQGGFAEFTGIAEASVIGTSHSVGDIVDKTLMEGSLYHGSSTGTVDFSFGTIDIRSQLKNGLGEVITVTTNGVLRGSGTIDNRQTRIAGALANGGVIAGDFDGHLFGPTGNDLGGVFAGQIGRADAADDKDFAAVTGMVIMSQNGPRRIGAR